MKILVVVPSYKPAYHYGGPIHSIAALCEAMVREGHTVRVLTTNANGKSRLPVHTGTACNVEGVEVIYFNRWTGDHSNFSPSLLIALWRMATKYNVVHLHSWWNLVILPSVTICLSKGIRPFLSPRGSITSYTFNHQKARVKQFIHKVAGKRLLKKCKLHITSLQEKEDVQTYLDNPSVCLLPNLLELKPPVKVKVREKEQLRLIYLGRVDPKKNIEFLLDVVLSEFKLPFTLEFIGNGDSAYVDTLKSKTDKFPSISWLGPIYDDRKWSKLASSDILLLPSNNENYGNVILEALSQGTAVLISPNVGIKDYVTENHLGWVEPLQAELWRSRLRQLFNHKEQLLKIRQSGPECIRRDFQQSLLVSKYIDMYNNRIVVSTSEKPAL